MGICLVVLITYTVYLHSRRIVSQCNSRDTSKNRGVSPKDNDGFRVPSAVGKSATWSSANQVQNYISQQKYFEAAYTLFFFSVVQLNQSEEM